MHYVICFFRNRCVLYQFITDFVKDVYLGEKQHEINQQIDSVTKGTSLKLILRTVYIYIKSVEARFNMK